MVAHEIDNTYLIKKPIYIPIGSSDLSDTMLATTGVPDDVRPSTTLNNLSTSVRSAFISSTSCKNTI